MGQFSNLVNGLTLTDGVADGALVRESTKLNISNIRWNYESAMKNFFIDLQDSDIVSCVKKTKGTLLPVMELLWSKSNEGRREDCAFLLALFLRHEEEAEEFLFYPSVRSNSAEDVAYVHSFMMELLLPEEQIRAVFESQLTKEDSVPRLLYAGIMDNYGVTPDLMYVRMQELDLL